MGKKEKSPKIATQSLDEFMSPSELAELLGLPSDESLEDNELARSLRFDPVQDVKKAKIVAVVNKAAKGTTAQTLRLFVDGVEVDRWKVSTGREQWETPPSGRKYFSTTPLGYFRPTFLDEHYWSKTWEAEMEFSIFIIGGIALHATTPSHYPELGFRASGGCIRQHRENAKKLFRLAEGLGVTTVSSIARDGHIRKRRDGSVITTRNYDLLVIVHETQD